MIVYMGRKKTSGLFVSQIPPDASLRAMLYSGGMNMRVRIIGPAQAALAWQYQVENLGEDWRCVPAGEELLLLLPGQEGRAALSDMLARPPLAPPFILGNDALDGPLPPVEELPKLVQTWHHLLYMPALASVHLPMTADIAAAMLRVMAVPPRLKAWDFLPQMCAWTVVHPPLLTDLQHGLYPLIGQQHGLSAGAVERRLRLCVESTWVHGSLPALERFFGDSVDPEKGKPTNREFLCRVQERLTLAVQRLV